MKFLFAVLHSRLGSRGRDSYVHVVGLTERTTISCSQEDLKFLQNSKLHSGAWTFCVRHFVSSTSPFNIIALDRLKNLMNIAFVGNTEHFQVPAITSYLLSYMWTSNIVPVTISLRQFPEDVSISLPIVHAKVSALSLVTERVSPRSMWSRPPWLRCFQCSLAVPTTKWR